MITAVWGHSEAVLCEIWRRHVPTAFDASDEPSHPAALTALPFSTVFFFSDDISSDDKFSDAHYDSFSKENTRMVSENGVDKDVIIYLANLLYAIPYVA